MANKARLALAFPSVSLWPGAAVLVEKRREKEDLGETGENGPLKKLKSVLFLNALIWRRGRSPRS